MALRPDQVETILKAINERTMPAPLSRPITPAQIAYVEQQLPAAFEAIGIRTVTDAAMKATLASDTHLYTLRERALYVQPAELLSRRFFRFRDRMPALHTTLVRLFTDAAGVGQHKIRLWNPFCGCGADTYSLAALARLAKGATGAQGGTIEVIGTDVLPGCLQYAERGVYEFRRSEWQAHVAKLTELFGPEAAGEDAFLPISTRHLPAGVEPLFAVNRLPDMSYAISPNAELRKMTKFRAVNPLRIAELGQLGSFEAVASFHRSVVSDMPYGRQYRTALAYAVRPGGYLILPATPEPPPDITAAGGFEMREPGLFCRVR